MTRDELIEDITFAIASNFNEEPISVTKAVLSAIEAAGFKLVRFTKTTPPPFNFDDDDGKQDLLQIVEDAQNSVRTALGALLEVKEALTASPLKQGEGV